MPRSNSDAGDLNEATGTEPQKGTKWKKKKWALLDKLWATVISFHRWPLAVIWLFKAARWKHFCCSIWDFLMCDANQSRVLSDYQSHNPLLFFLSHSGWPWPCVWRWTRNPLRPPPKCQIVLFHTISNTSCTVRLNTFSKMSSGSN